LFISETVDYAVDLGAMLLLAEEAGFIS